MTLISFVHRVRWSAAALLIVVHSALASGTDASLAHWLSLSLENNARIQSAYHQWQQQQSLARGAGALPDPMLSIDYFIDEVQTRTGPQEYRIMLAQKIPWFGKRDLASSMAHATAGRAEQQLLDSKQQLQRQLTHLWADGVFVERDRQLTQENLALLEHIERLARTRYRLAQASHPDLVRIQLQRSKVDNQLATLARDKQDLLANLRFLSQRRVPDSFAWPAEFPLLPALPAARELEQRVSDNHPLLAGLRYQADLRQDQIKAARLRNRPDMTLQYGRIITGAANNPALDGSGDDPQYVGVGINIPLWINKTRHLETAAEHAQQVTQADINDAQRSLLNRLALALHQLTTADEQLERYQTVLIPQADTSLVTLLQAYQTGSGGFSDLLEAEKLLLELKREKANLQRLRWKAHADVVALTGDSLTELKGNRP